MKKNTNGRFLFLLLLAFGYLTSGLCRAESLQYRLQNLERLIEQSKATPEDTVDLAELYFLTSRCDDAKKILQKVRGLQAVSRGPEILCICGGRCSGKGLISDLRELRTLLASKAPWKSHKIQRAWKKLVLVPEARAMVLARLRREPKLRSELVEIERELLAMDIP